METGMQLSMLCTWISTKDLRMNLKLEEALYWIPILPPTSFLLFFQAQRKIFPPQMRSKPLLSSWLYLIPMSWTLLSSNSYSRAALLEEDNLFQELRSGQYQARAALNHEDARDQESLDFALLESAKKYAKSTLSIDKMYKTATKILQKAEIENADFLRDFRLTKSKKSLLRSQIKSCVEYCRRKLTNEVKKATSV